MGAYPFSQAVKHPEHMCPDCANVIGPVDVFGNNPDDNKCEGAGMKLKPQWGGKLEGQAKNDPTQEAQEICHKYETYGCSYVRTW